MTRHNQNEDQGEAERKPQAARCLVFVLVPDSQPLGSLSDK